MGLWDPLQMADINGGPILTTNPSTPGSLQELRPLVSMATESAAFLSGQEAPKPRKTEQTGFFGEEKWIFTLFHIQK